MLTFDKNSGNYMFRGQPVVFQNSIPPVSENTVGIECHECGIKLGVTICGAGNVRDANLAALVLFEASGWKTVLCQTLCRECCAKMELLKPEFNEIRGT